MEIPKTIDEFLDRYPCGYSDSWRKIINKHLTQSKMDFKVKFFGSKERKGQITQVKMTVEAPSREAVKDVLEIKLGYKRINGLKIQ